MKSLERIKKDNEAPLRQAVPARRFPGLEDPAQPGTPVLEPINDYVAVEIIPHSNIPPKIGSIFVPDMKKNDKFIHGRVIGVGAGKVTLSGTRVPPSVKVGDTVVFDSAMGQAYRYLNIDCVILDEGMIQAKLKYLT